MRAGRKDSLMADSMVVERELKKADPLGAVKVDEWVVEKACVRAALTAAVLVALKAASKAVMLVVEWDSYLVASLAVLWVGR